MCAVFHARAATRDVDAIFAPTAEIRKAAKAIALEHDVPQDWLNDAAKGFFGALPPQMPFREWPNLRVWSPSPEYMLAMKCVAARYDTSDADDVKHLIGLLKLTEPDQVFSLVDTFYPNQQVPAKTRFFIEELMQKMHCP